VARMVGGTALPTGFGAFINVVGGSTNMRVSRCPTVHCLTSILVAQIRYHTPV